MMKKHVVLLAFLFLHIGLFSQCPISVSLSSIPDVTAAPVCKSTPVQLTASPSLGVVVSQYIWVVDNDTITTTGATINVLANTQTITVYMQTTTGCTPSPDTVSSTIQIKTVHLESIIHLTKINCSQFIADIRIETQGNGSPSYLYEIENVGESSNSLFSNVPEGTRTLFITDSDGCKDTNEFEIVHFECPNPIPSSIITPNSDGFNDTWQIANIHFYPTNEVFIFDRWGQRVYHKKGYDNADGWDAKYIGVNLPVSTYYFLLKATSKNEAKDVVLKGPISIFR